MTDDDVIFEEEDGEGNVKSPEEKLRVLKQKLEVALKERGEYLDGWQRSKADYVNLKKRTEEDRGMLLQYANQALIESLIPVLDSFEYAEAHAGATGLDAGLRNTISQLYKALESNGVTIFDPMGEVFDPGRHESVETVAVTEATMDNVVTKVLQKGYALNSRIIRPARVAVGHYQK